MLKVSIIVPVYNAEKTLIRCLDSLTGQTYHNQEIILINDGSTDNSQEICERYSRTYSYITLINQKNAGPATARNVGIDRATGDYISFVDSDDYVEPNMVESMVSEAENHSADMVICGYYQESGGKITQHKFKYKPGLYQGEGARKIAVELISDVSDTRIPPYSWIRMVRRDVFENPRIRYSDGMIRSEDYYFYVQIHFRVKRLYLLVDKPLYHYMEVSSSVTHKYVKHYWESVKKIYSGLKEQLPAQIDINKRLDIMLVQRSLIALNNAAKSDKITTFSYELFEIVKDNTLKNVMKWIPFNEGVRLWKGYYVLSRIQAYNLIYVRYLYKFTFKYIVR